MKQIIPANKGVDVVLSINNIPLGGQKNATLNRRMTPINITNKITGEWSTSLSGVRTWSLNCSGIFIKDDEAFHILEDAFNNGTAIHVVLTDDNIKYEGEALITSFPLSTNYSDSCVYSINLIGNGELK